MVCISPGSAITIKYLRVKIASLAIVKSCVDHRSHSWVANILPRALVVG